MPRFYVGFATGDITPPVGVAMAGYGNRDHGAESVETSLSVKAMVVESDGAAAALAVADLVGVSTDIVDGIRQAVSGQTEIPSDALMVCATHTHWGPAVGEYDYLPTHLKACVPSQYIESLTQTIAETVIEAWEQRAVAAVGWGTGLADGISFNRRPVGADGKTVQSFELPPDQAMIAAAAGREMQQAWRKGGCGGPRLSPPLADLDGLRAGVTDPQIPLLKVQSADGTPLMGLVNFACHPVVGGDDNFYSISPDYPYQARQSFEAVVGAPLIFTLGCAGDQVPAWRRGDSRVRVGRSLGGAASRQWYQIEHCTAEPQVATARQEITLALKDLPSIAEAREALSACDDPDGPEAGHQRHQLATAEKYANRAGIETEITALRIGDWAAVGVPGEVLAEIGLQIKQQSPFSVTAVISLANDSAGYISTAQAHREGGYEPKWSPAGPEAERQVVDAAVALLRSLV